MQFFYKLSALMRGLLKNASDRKHLPAKNNYRLDEKYLYNGI